MTDTVESVGNDKAGFSVAVDAVHHTIHVAGWGFWDVTVAKAFDAAVIGPCRQWPGRVRVKMDMARLKPMRDEGQEAFANVVSELLSLGFSEASVTTTSHLIKLQLLRISNDVGARGMVRFIDGNHEGGNNGQ